MDEARFAYLQHLRQAEGRLTEWALIRADRDNLVRAAIAAGVTRYRVHQLTGIARSTIERIIRSGNDPVQDH